MSNHVHLVVDPGDDGRNISATMKRLAGRHARRLNRRNSWSGALWESRFKCSPIDTGRYLLTCGRYVDLNPVRAGLVSSPAAYAWSSYRARAGLTSCAWLDPDPSIEALANTPARRQLRYRELAGEAIDEDDVELIRSAVRRNQLTGADDFVEKVKRDEGLSVPHQTRGRPRKTPRNTK
jgi:putative transposase